MVAATAQIARFVVELNGTQPLLMNNYAPDEFTCRKQTLSSRERAEKTICRGPDGEIGIPASMLLACFCTAGEGITIPRTRRRISIGTGNRVPEFVWIEGDFIPLLGSKRWGVYSKSARLHGGTVARIIRARFRKWGLRVSLLFNPLAIPGGVSEEILWQLVERAGRKGLGASRKIFGKFEITSWQKVQMN